MLVPNRHDSLEDYRYGFQGQEKDDEVKGEGNSLNYTFRMHDSRVGRFFAVDPLTGKYPHYSPYSFSGNKVIHAIELEGLEEYVVTTNTDKQLRHFAVRVDDNLSVIAKTTGVALNDILKWNEKTLNGNPNLIYPGQTILLFDSAGLTMAYFAKPKQSSFAEQVFIKLVTTDEYGPSIQSQADAVLTAGAVAGGVEVVRSIPKLLSKAPKTNYRPKDYYGNSTPVVEKAPKISTIDDFITPHAFVRHKYNPNATSSKSKTQYGENVNVTKIREETLNKPDKIVKHYDANGTHYATTYKKTFKDNISTKDTPTNESRVIINHIDPSRSSQFPLYQKPN
jgi:RHS repeat-associated protein